MPLFVRKNIRIIGSNELLFPVLAVERIQLTMAFKGKGVLRWLELFHLEDGQTVPAEKLLFLEPVDEDLLIAMRLEARMLWERDKRKINRGRPDPE